MSTINMETQRSHHMFSHFQTQHEGRCEFERITCEACSATILLSEKDRHNERECEARTLNCKYCKMTFNFKDIKVKYVRLAMLKVPYDVKFT